MTAILQLYKCFCLISYTRYAKWKWRSFYKIVGLTRATFMQVSSTRRFFPKIWAREKCVETFELK